MDLQIYNTKEEVARNFAEYLENWIKENDEVHIALSGGSTPKIVFDELSNTEKYNIDWSEVHLYWGDERCVPPTDEQSNYKMTQDHLLEHIDIPSKNIHRIFGENDPKKEALRYGDVLSENMPPDNEAPVFDMVILGMGEDGHTASIFPHEIGLWNSKSICEVAIHPDSGQKRISITGKVINHSKTVVFLVTGFGKKEKVAEIIHKTGDYTKYPASLVAPHSGNLTWFLDADAASLL
ncbi:MAG: 6-phosphogluconolactonase [Eudoraea sp.]|nr:6-phosphogluconolactonase [Eudoraea sp.]